MSRLLYRLGHLCVRHRFVVVGLWAVALVAVLAIVSGVGAQTSNDLTIPGSDSTKAQDILDSKLPGQANGSVPMAITSTERQEAHRGPEQADHQEDDPLARERPRRAPGDQPAE